MRLSLAVAAGKIHAYIAGGIYHPGNSTTKTFGVLVPNWTVTYRVLC